MKSSIYYGGTIITMEGELYAEAVLVEDGVIAAVGKKDAIFSFKKQDTHMVDLCGKTMLPAFIDSHSHFVAFANTLRLVKLSGATSFEEILNTINDFKTKNNIKKGEWIVGFGYDHNILKENTHPTKDILDKISSDNPILITHSSGHMGVLNSLALKELGITDKTPNPEGGVIGRVANTDEPSGYLEEAAFISISTKVPRPTHEEMEQAIIQAEKIYLKNGITTIQEGKTQNEEWKLLIKMAQKEELTADVVCYENISSASNLISENPSYIYGYKNRLKLGGYKIFLDGSPQGRTAWMSSPYEGFSDGYVGYAKFDDKQVFELISKAYDSNVQILAHCNGDAACEQFISMFEKLNKEYPDCTKLRPVMIHAQFVRKDQLKRMKNINMIASFFMAHVYYWSDVHIKNMGKQRAIGMSPASSAINEGVVYTFHQDTPVLEPDMIKTIWCAVNRINQKGVLIGANERISVNDALRAVTINAAYQYFEEEEKGSIKNGKIADFVILDKNPYEVEVMDIDKIKIITTIKNDKIVWSS